ncbi:hypothetical protein [Phaeovulum sp.]|uniref:hypothetical protein n=1 Tax=Phaeovulum sp. TaxID=2934796 RepID=UPI003561E892
MNMLNAAPDWPATPNAARDITARLAAPRAAIERDFLQMGEKLIACTRLLGEVSEAYAQMSGALAGPEFAGLVEALRNISGHVARLNQSSMANRAFLAELSDLTGQFPNKIAGLSKAVRTLRMFFVTARVAAATISDRENNLSQFAEEFTRLGGLLESNVASFADAFLGMRDSLDAARAMNEQIGAEHRQLLCGIGAEQARNLAAMESQRIWAEARIAAHGALSERISARVARAVCTLQVGDSTRQRVEHIEAACQKTEGIDDSATLASAYALMAAQLQGAITDFDAEIAELAASLEDLAREAVAMLQSAETDAGSLLSTGDAAFGAINASVLQIARMLERYERSDAALSVAIDQLVAAVGNMLEHVSAFEDIRQAVRLISLNATIRAKVLDEDGQAFRQVAKELRILNDETSAPVEEVMQNLKKSADVLQGFLDAGTRRDDRHQAGARDILESAREKIDNISSVLRDRAAFMSGTGAEVVARLRDAARTASDQQDFCRDWRALEGELQSAALRTHPNEGGFDGQADIISEIYKIYTIKVERDIHNALFGGVAQAAIEVTGADAASGLDDIFF